VTHVVLIVDDSEFVRQALAAALDGAGIAVISAKNGREALEVLDGDSVVSAMILDTDMPILDGAEVLRRLRERRRKPPFIIAVGRPDTDRLRECQRLGADETRTKPLDVESLCSLLRAALRERSSAP